MKSKVSKVMKTKTPISLNQALEEAIKLGFNNRFVLRNESIHSFLTNEDFTDSEFAVVKSYPVILNNGQKGRMRYIVLNNGHLGFLLNATKSVTHQKTLSHRNSINR